jgi:hypothetical protein
MASRELTIFRVHMKDALLAAKHGEGELAVLYQEVANDVGEKVRARGDKVSAVELQADIDRAFERTAFKRIKIIKTSIEKGAALGPKASRKTMREVYGEEVGRAQVRASKKALTQAADRIAGRVTVDGVAVSKRIRRVDRAIAGEMAREVERGVRQKKGILGAARKIEKLDPRSVELPQYLQKVETAARAGNLVDLKKLTHKYTRYAARLGEVQQDLTRTASKYSLRSATQRFLKDAEKTGAKGIDQIVQRYIKDKAAFRANLIARHETVEAYRRSYIEQSKNKPGVIGMQWRISPTRHPIPDECDIYANQNAFKLGPGVYPADKVPRHPHPACLCSVTVVLDKDHFKRGEAANDNAGLASIRDEKSPGALGWLAQNEQAAAKILGPTRHTLMKQGVNVLDHEGKPLLVRELLGAQRQKMAVGTSSFSPAMPAPKGPALRRTKANAPARSTRRTQPASGPEGRLPTYGQAAPRVAEASRTFEELVDRAVYQAPAGAPTELPGALELAKDTAVGLEQTFGLKQVRSIHTVAPMTDPDYAGLMYWDGRMQLSAAGPRRATYRTLVHETLHTLGGVRQRGYQGVGLVIEESATEELADAYCGGTWKFMKRGAKLNLDDTDKAYASWLHRPPELRCEGVYRGYRERIMSLVSAATGEVDPSALSARVRAAMATWKRERYDVPAEAMRAFIDALEPSESQRRFYERAMLSPKSWKVR